MDVFFEQYKPASSVAQFLLHGSKHQGAQTLGFELEHFVVKRDSLAAVPYCVSADSSAPSVEKILLGLEGFYDEAIYEQSEDGDSHLYTLKREKAAVSLEPGAQLEISIGPVGSLSEIEQHYSSFRAELDPILESMGLSALNMGYHPTGHAENLSLLPKYRYIAMDEYFRHTGSQGLNMMRATASTQVSIDYEDEPDAVAKYRIANALGPLFSFITDNAPVFEASDVGLRSGVALTEGQARAIPYRMARTTCWDDTDPKRCLTIRECFDEDFSFLRYAETLIESPGIFLPAPHAGGQTVKGPEHLGFTTYKQALPDEFIDESMVQHILSLAFYDTRFRTYLELRQADSLPIDYALAYAALISGIFYNRKALDYYTDAFQYTDIAAVAFAKSALRSKGYEAEVYGRSACEWLDEMVEFALDGLAAEDACYLTPLAGLVAGRRTPVELLYP